MQITQKFQRVLDIFVKVLKFVWRNVFVFVALCMLVTAFLMYPAIDWNKFFIEIIVAIGFDKIKTNWSHHVNNNYQISSISSFSQANYWNSSIAGTPAYLSELGRRY